jgi:hypothetical protein
VDDLIKSFKAQLYDRVTSPLLSSFLISWVAWNHRIFFVLTTSDLKLKERFDFADNLLYPTWKEVLGRGLMWPLLSALALLFLYPIPGRWVYEYVRKEQKRLKEIQQRIDDDTPITQQEAKELRAALRKADADFQKELAARDEVIVRLKSELAKTEQTSETPTDPSPSGDINKGLRLSGERIDEKQIALLRRVAESPDGLTASLALRYSDEDPVIAQYNLDELVKRSFVVYVRAFSNVPSKYKATAEGRAFLVTAERERAS